VAANEPGVSVASVALAHGLNTNMVFRWRRDYRAGLFNRDNAQPALLPVSVVHSNISSDIPAGYVADAPIARASTVSTPRPRGKGPSGFIEIELNGARICVHGTVESEQLRLVLQCLSSTAEPI
jgi:transposase